ncbi:MAG TPA: hypothetical protein VK612_10990 [Pyrinomonadaceae bacterium]|nr:hypothetical protein [Pyrinomonadaceae bacterium]
MEFLLYKSGDAEKKWSKFSLAQAMRGLDNDDMPEYTDADLKDKWQ